MDGRDEVRASADSGESSPPTGRFRIPNEGWWITDRTGLRVHNSEQFVLGGPRVCGGLNASHGSPFSTTNCVRWRPLSAVQR
jgi:hypothetical protein